MDSITEDEEVVTMDLPLEYICALTNLYGHVSPGRVCEVYNQQNDERLKFSEVELYIKNPNQQVENRYIYIYRGKFLEEIYYLFEDRYKELIAKQKDKPYYIPAKNELLKYAELSYWEKPAEYQELETYIQMNYFSNNESMSENLANEIFEHIQMGHINEAMKIFEHYEIIFNDEKESGSVLYIIQRLHNNTRMKVNNGYTPLELSEITGTPTYRLPNKFLDSDDDCHCGSKKKYKDCHFESDEKIKRLKDYRD